MTLVVYNIYLVMYNIYNVHAYGELHDFRNTRLVRYGHQVPARMAVWRPCCSKPFERQ